MLLVGKENAQNGVVILQINTDKTLWLYFGDRERGGERVVDTYINKSYVVASERALRAGQAIDI